MGFLRQEYWSGWPFPSPGDLPSQGNEPMSPVSPALGGGLFTSWDTGEAYAHQTTPHLSVNTPNFSAHQCCLLIPPTWWPNLSFPFSALANSYNKTSIIHRSLAQMVKSLPAVQDTWVQPLGWEDYLEKEMVTHSSILPWRIPWTEEPGGGYSPWGGKKLDMTEWLTHFITKHFLAQIWQNTSYLLLVLCKSTS